MNFFTLEGFRFCKLGLRMGFLTLLVVVGSVPAVGQDGNYDIAPTFQASTLLPGEMLSSSSYKIKENVSTEGMFYSFQVWSRFGWFQPRSYDMLRIRLAEIHALNILTQMQQDPLFLEGVGEQVTGTIESTANAVRRPLKTIRDIPLGLEKFGRQVQAKVQEGDTLPDDGVRGVHEGAKRELAVSLGVDPYSDNAPLQQALAEVARNKNRGALVTRVGTAFIPAVGPALGAAQLNKGLQGRLANMTAAELQKETRENLGQLGVPSGEVDRFVSNPGYTPTIRAAISDALSALASVQGIQQIIRASQEIPAPEVALFYQRRVQMAEKFHQSVRPLDKLTLAGATPVFLDRSGNVVIVAPVDYMYWSEDLARRVAMVRSKVRNAKCDLCITGTATQRARDNLAAAGITLHENW